MGTEQNKVPASVNMDARNFLRAINNSAQSKVVFFENVVKRLGQEAKRAFKLTALHPASLIFEDTKTNEYYVGDIKKDGPRYIVDNIKRVNVVEEKKADLFDKNCTDLVEAISESDFKSAEKVFNKIELQRFRSRVIPESGLVTTRDGDVHRIKTTVDVIEEDKIPKIIKAFSDAVADQVELLEGQVVRGVFTETGDAFTLPVDEITRRRIVARRMREIAESAYESPTFQKFVVNIAGLVCEHKVSEAVEVAAKFLREEQEFCLLNKAGMTKLVESTFATQSEFNSFLIEDVATLMYKTNLKVNKDTIVDCWTKTAQKAQSPDMLANAQALGESKDFASAYNVFIEGVFSEANDIDSTRAKAYLVSLKVIKNVLKHIDGQDQLVQDIEHMVGSLETEEPSTDIIYQTEELLAGISDTIIDRIQTLDGFDRMPGVDDKDEAAVEPEEEQDETPVPLPDLGGEEEEALVPDMAMASAEAPVAPEMAKAAAESKKAGKPIVEDYTPIEKMNAIELQEELLSWKTDGHIFLKEDGFDDCFNQINKYIDRCHSIGSAAADMIREEFEGIRDTVIDSGNDVVLDLPDDPYDGKIELKENVKINSDYSPLSEELGGLSGPEKGVKHSGDASGMSELQDNGGVVKSGVKTSDGKSGDSAPSNSGAVEGDPGMSKDNQGKTKGLSDKGMKKVSGADAAGTPSNKGAVDGDPGMSKDNQGKTKAIGESITDKIAAALDEGELKVEAKHTGGGGYKKPHDLDMSELQGKNGVDDGDAKKTDGKGAGGVPPSKGAEKTDLDMAKDFQSKTSGLAESDDTKKVVSEVPPTEGEPTATEDQKKGPRMHADGRKKAALAPREVKESKESKKSDSPFVEDVAVVYSRDERIDDVISRVIAAMDKAEGMDMGSMDVPTVPELPSPVDEIVGGMPLGDEEVLTTGAEEVPEEAPEETDVEKAPVESKTPQTKVVNEEHCPECKKPSDYCKCPCPDCGKDTCECK
jgi:hypothetical protein